MEIYVGNLPWSVRDQELAEAFGPYGSVEKASVITYRDSGCLLYTSDAADE